VGLANAKFSVGQAITPLFFWIGQVNAKISVGQVIAIIFLFLFFM